MAYTLGPTIRMPIPGAPGVWMHIGEDVRKSVLFFGYPDATPGRGGINCIGTGFLLTYDDVGYLVTAKHLAHDLGGHPFLIRLNKKDGSSQNLYADQVEWTHHPDPTVDVSVMQLHIGGINDFDIKYLMAASLLLSTDQVAKEAIGVGNLTYTIGLFRLLSGEKRNLPICHFGSIALNPSDEKIPIVDWTDPTRQGRIHVEGYLVESQSLAGLSGSPVFVRPEHSYDIRVLLNIPAGDETRRPGDGQAFVGPRNQLRLLGIWQGAWEAPPDEVRAAQTGGPAKVPVGMGIVVPCQRIIEVLEMPKLKQQHNKIKNELAASAAVTQTVAHPAASDSSSGENPMHREGFTSLVDAAARKRPQGDKT